MIIISYAQLAENEAEEHRPCVVHVDGENRVREVARPEFVPGGEYRVPETMLTT